jgi:hypothetical protein
MSARGRVDHWRVTVTDTFAGEANYAWVRRYEFTAPAGASQRDVIRRAKATAGWQGRTTTERDGGDGFIVRPGRGECFVKWDKTTDGGGV